MANRTVTTHAAGTTQNIPGIFPFYTSLNTFAILN
jgi:hypothetical protein